MFNERLLQERERLCLSQIEMAEKCGVTPRSQRNYEKGERQPDAVYIAALAAIGADVLYILTGQRTPATAALSKREAALLDNYRHCNPDGQEAVEKVAFVAAKPKGLANGTNTAKAVG